MRIIKHLFSQKQGTQEQASHEHADPVRLYMAAGEQDEKQELLKQGFR